MQTSFSPAQLADPAMASSESVIRKCVHCGFCTATCPTYVLLGDELDSPRGRIYLMKEMLEKEQTPTREVVKHIDRCLSCLSCITTCPSGVNYMHLVDHARAYIEDHYRRPFRDRLFRATLAAVLPHRGRFRLALRVGRMARALAPLLARSKLTRPASVMLALVPDSIGGPAGTTPSPASGPEKRGRILLLQGCAEPVLRPEFRSATIRLLNRLGYDVVFAKGEVCCGALVHHLGREDASLAAARRNVELWARAIDTDGVTAIVSSASGCGSNIKNYGYMLRNDPAYAERAARVAALARDVTEILGEGPLPPTPSMGLTVAYHGACSLQHGQQIKELPRNLLVEAGFAVRTPSEAHLCCGSAGTYNILQPELAAQLGDRKAEQLERLEADVIATGNIGCAVQIGQRTPVPVVHVVELVDWATGGPRPAALGKEKE